MFNKNDGFDSKKSEKGRKRTRVREIDFMRVEDTAQSQELAPFELEIKDEIASAESPYEKLASQEKRGGDKELKRVSKYKLTCLMRKAKLTSRQAECYQLIWVKEFSENKTAKKLGISRSRVRDLKQVILSSLASALEKEKNRNRIATKARFACKSKKQYKIWRLYFKQGKTISEIGRDMSLSRQSVHQFLKRILPTV